ncbi:unnamed protein product [Caenorhabditis auriculariae]|uniref:RNA helicase n=1 Tax=Caenorhabditis auriculariae TaxID=2777116 RepID=A0A8S1H684_9PELO|nr:unnamed protein product [Caenorhabditis auriculariae]
MKPHKFKTKVSSLLKMANKKKKEMRSKVKKKRSKKGGETVVRVGSMIGADQDAVLLEADKLAEKTEADENFSRGAQTSRMARPQLPIDLVEYQLMASIASNDTIIVIGETGSGKSTQLPQICYRLLNQQKTIAVTQPRRVAAIALATRVAKEMGTELGDEAGYHIRFEKMTSSKTKIEYMTDGILLRKALTSPLLNQYSVIIVDEAHERSMHTDVLMCMLKTCQRQRDSSKNPLKLIIMSATLKAKKFKDYFDGAPVMVIPGRPHPIDILYLMENEKDTSYLRNSLVTVKQVHLKAEKGQGILLFLTGAEEIEESVKQLEKLNKSLPPSADRIFPIPLYSAQRPEQQREAFLPAPPGTRKVILSTNIAETSLTIPGIRIVIDCLHAKIKNYNSVERYEELNVQLISKAQATQRAGRAGREAHGTCYRLIQHSKYEKLQEDSVPEILRSNLAATFLELLKVGMQNPHKLKLIDMPSADSISASMRELKAMGAIAPIREGSSRFQLTEHGETLCAFPLPPDHARIVTMAEKEGCVSEVLKIVAAMQAEWIMYPYAPYGTSDEEFARARARFETREGDHLTILKVMLATHHFMKQRPNGEKVLNGGMNDPRKIPMANLKNYCDENIINMRNLKTATLIEKQLRDIVVERGGKVTSCGVDFTSIRKCLAHGLFLNSCEYDRQEDRYRLMVNPSVTLRIHPSSVLSRSKPNCIVFTELLRNEDLYALHATLIDSDWVRPLITAYRKTTLK